MVIKFTLYFLKHINSFWNKDGSNNLTNPVFFYIKQLYYAIMKIDVIL